jgi:hypothetical protein
MLSQKDAIFTPPSLAVRTTQIQLQDQRPPESPADTAHRPGQEIAVYPLGLKLRGVTPVPLVVYPQAAAAIYRYGLARDGNSLVGGQVRYGGSYLIRLNQTPNGDTAP